MQKHITIGNKIIGPGHDLFIIAETGVTCNYDMAITRDLIDVAADAGADAIKFIFWFPEEIMADRSVTYSYQTVNGPRTENMFEMLSKLRFNLDQWREIKAYADSRQLLMFATVNSPSGISYAEELELAAYKLSSWDFNYLPLWRSIAAMGKPLIIDTGPVTILDVAKVMRVMAEADNDQAVLIHCFHTDDPAEKNMRTIPYLAKAFGTPSGFSSSGREDETDVMAVALGASVIEKRLTMSRDLPGHHHFLSKNPEEFTAYIKMIRTVQAALGEEVLMPSKGDLSERKKWFRHLVANEDILAGTVLTAAMVEGKRGEAGISPEHLDLVVGRTARRDLAKDEDLAWEDL
ncbi:MAG: N-acetylneuraminate synthase family protein [Proteobacteria bacterium]|nr:N-acetylneuraminate synthase family protein [Pseudomonadota bacterium]MBU1687949.1 N-acetylneuraminate synthase family protein [Pseudomonadota bacterium]